MTATNLMPTQSLPPSIQAFAAGTLALSSVPVIDDRGPMPLSLPASVSQRSESAATLLVVEDEEITRRLLIHQLQRKGFQILSANHGQQALEVLSRHVPDAIVMDITMPEMDGIDTLHAIRQQFNCIDLPVIMMTAETSSDRVVECFEAGANDYISKPVDLATLVVRLDSQLRLRTMHSDLLESQERYQLASAGTRDGIWDWNIRTDELYLSPRWRSLVGMEDPDAQLRGIQWLQYVMEEDRARVTAELQAHLNGETDYFETELRLTGPEKDHRWMLCRGLAVRDASNLPIRIAGSLSDVTEGKVADALTRLPNRLLFQDRVARCVQMYKRDPKRRFAIMYMDVNDFKLVNDSLGHDVGDAFLIQFAQRLQSELRQGDAVLARLGGDEFAVLLENISEEEDAVMVAKRLRTQIERPFQIAGREIISGLSIGIVTINEKNASVDTLIRQADAAMYHAKRYCDKKWCVFDQQMLDESRVKLELGSELKHAIRRDELCVMYQPIVDARKNRTAGFEALMRWNHPVHGPVSPSDFIPIAENNGLIVEIGKWILFSACKQAVQWSQIYERPMAVSVNVSIRQLTEPDFVRVVKDCLKETGLQPGQLKLEITESMLMRKPEQMIPLLCGLNKIGVATGIDDFGTGYSSLSYLHQMPLDALKIDRSFVENMVESSKHQAIVGSILALSRSLGLKVIAEGIETKQQAAYLRSLQCDFFQGFHFSKPLLAAQASALIDHDWTQHS